MFKKKNKKAENNDNPEEIKEIQEIEEAEEKEKSQSFVADVMMTSVKYFKWVVLIIIAGIMLSGIRTVNQGEVAVILRFGKLCGNTREEQVHEPGLMFAFPYIIDEVITVPTGKVFELNVDTHYTGGSMSSYVDENGYCITGDSNIAVISSSLKYMISDPVQYALSTRDIESTVRGTVSASIAQSTLSMTIDSLLTDGKDDFAAAVLEKSQEMLDNLECGITITNFELNTVAPPIEVKDIFDEVTAATVDAQTLLAEARQYLATLIPQTQSEANLLVSEAQSNQSTRVSAVKQSLAEFYGLLDEFEKQPEVVIIRMYNTKMTELYKKLGRVYVVGDGMPNIFIK